MTPKSKINYENHWNHFQMVYHDLETFRTKYWGGEFKRFMVLEMIQECNQIFDFPKCRPLAAVCGYLLVIKKPQFAKYIWQHYRILHSQYEQCNIPGFQIITITYFNFFLFIPDLKQVCQRSMSWRFVTLLKQPPIEVVFPRVAWYVQ